MPAAAFLGCFCSGHEGWPSRPTVSASPDVYVEDAASHRVGDLWNMHTCGIDGHNHEGRQTHDGITVSGSSDVYVNDVAKARVSDLVDCGSLILSGAESVKVND